MPNHTCTIRAFPLDVPGRRGRRSEPAAERQCASCGASFTPLRADSQCCRPSCSHRQAAERHGGAHRSGSLFSAALAPAGSPTTTREA